MNPILKNLADNPLLLESLREHLDKHFSLEGITTETPNCELAEKVRARLEGKELLKAALKEIEKLKTVPEPPERVNQAR